MSKRTATNKKQVRERRNHLLESAAAAKLSVNEGVREMRAIAGMTQQEFARHRGVSARVIKAIELCQGNPTVATLNRIGQFFGLEVAFVPIIRNVESTVAQPDSNLVKTEGISTDIAPWEVIRQVIEKRNNTVHGVHRLTKMISDLDETLHDLAERYKPPETDIDTPLAPLPRKEKLPTNSIVEKSRVNSRKK